MRACSSVLLTWATCKGETWPVGVTAHHIAYDQAHIVERYHQQMDARGTRVLVATWTLTDPVFYTKPFSSEKKWALDPKGILLPYECDEETWLDHLEDLKSGKSSQKTY